MAEQVEKSINREELYELASRHIGVDGYLNLWKRSIPSLGDPEARARLSEQRAFRLFKVIHIPVGFIGPVEHHYELALLSANTIPPYYEEREGYNGGREIWYDPRTVNINDVTDYVGPDNTTTYPPMFNSDALYYRPIDQE